MGTTDVPIRERTGAEVEGPPTTPDRRCFAAVSLALWSAMVLNEVARAAADLWTDFGAVVPSLSLGLTPTTRAMIGNAASMLAIAGILTMLPCLLWAGVSLALREACRPRIAGVRFKHWVFWFVMTFSFFNVYYGLHQAVFPHSALHRSVLGRAVGVPMSFSPFDWSTGWVFGLTVPVVVSAVLVAFTRSLRFRRWMFGCSALLFITVLGYSRSTAVELRPFTESGNVVMLGIDSLQANRLAFDGSRPDIAPNINDFLSRSFRFANAWTPFARTYPSWLSILTGRYPVNHGVRFNLDADTRLDPGNQYLAQVLTDHGYTAAHATDETRFSILRPRFGFQRMLHPRMGITDFLLASLFDFSAANLARQTLAGHDLFPAIADNRASPGYSPEIFARHVVELMNELPRDRPVFIAVHLCGNHWPFSSRAPYCYTGDNDVEDCIAMVDYQVGQVLDAMRSSGLLDRSTTIMLSDHGDGWSGDRGDNTNAHGDDLETAVSNRVVLAMSGPGIAPGSTSELVRTIDLFPTVLDFVGIPYQGEFIDGRSLLPIMEGRPGLPRELFAESGIQRIVYDYATLIDESLDDYSIDPNSGLVFLSKEGRSRFMPSKSYMLLRNEERLVVTPHLARFELHAVDPETGSDLARASQPGDDQKIDLLRSLADHNELDVESVLRAARRRQFID